MKYLEDPVTNKPSVSLTLLAIAFITVTGFSIAEAMEKVNGVGSLMELFYACAALYFGRRVNIGGKIFSGKEKQSE